MVFTMGVLDKWRFCPICGEAIEKHADRVECKACGYVGYANSVPGAEAVCFDDGGRVLLGRRACDPGAGLWDLPGGFLHEDELPLDGLRRYGVLQGTAWIGSQPRSRRRRTRSLLPSVSGAGLPLRSVGYTTQ